MSCGWPLPGKIVLALFLAALPGALSGAPAEPAAGPPLSLQLVPLSGAPLSLTQADFERLPHKTVRATYPEGPDHKQVQAELSGVPLRELLNLLHLPADHDLRGEALQLYVVAEGADGYRVVFALAELDPGFSDHLAIVADRRDGKPLTTAEEPYGS
ncbi:MAG TPA: hypothetical protein VFE33_19850 [Thermoanaerobaculia bacterium]|nr:hypothetical protein [Thermoanaerobaculia bacterium]